MLRQDKSIGAFVLCNVRLHLEPWEGGGRGGGSDDDVKLSYIKTRTIKILELFLLVHNREQTVETLLSGEASGTVCHSRTTTR